MSTSESLYLIQDFTVILVAAIVAAAICKRINLSPVVGYLFAGVIVGTPQITFIYVTDAQRIHLLSQLGLIFLMFSIGLGFRIQRFKQLGLGMIIACVTTALLVLTLSRLVAGWIGLSQGASLFFSAMLMVSSSAVIGKSLQGQGLTHKRFGQLALGVTLCEDIVAIVMLTILGSYAAMDTQSGSGVALASQIGALLAFITLLLLPGVFFVPRILKRINLLEHDSDELQSIFVCAILFSMALLTLLSGYSLALGAFLTGVIVAESSQSRQVSASFSGLRDLFVAVFFVAIGMNVDITLFGDAIDLILLGTVLALVLRPIAAATGLLIACEEPPNAIKAGFSLSPIGEFSFVIANLGVAAGILEPRFQVAAVGVAFVTAILSPWFIQRNEVIGKALNFQRIGWLDSGLKFYQSLWASLSRKQSGSLIWKLLKPRIPQVAAEFLFVSAILVFASPLYSMLFPETDEARTVTSTSYRVGYWVVVTILAVTPSIALARNINAIALMIGDALTPNLSYKSASKKTVILALRGLGLVFLLLWIVNLIPFDWLGPYGLAGVIVTIFALVIFGWSQMVRLHSEATYTITQAVSQSNPAEEEERMLQKAREEWGIDLEEMPLGSISLAGRSISEMRIREKTGATIVGIERQGHYLPYIGPDTHLFSGDRVFAMGSSESIRQLRTLLTDAEVGESAESMDYRSAILESVYVPEGSPCIGKTLKSLNWPRLLGVQVAAIRKGDDAPRHPSAQEKLARGDILLLVGAPRSLAVAKGEIAAS